MEPLLIPAWPDAGKALGFGRTLTFEKLASGELESVLVGRKRLVPVDALRAYAERLRREQNPTAAA